MPNTVNVPLLSEKGELHASLSTHNLQAAYAVADGVGVVANGFYQSSDPDVGEGGRGYLLELGAGHFRTLRELLLLEIYGGAGYGRVEHDNYDTVGGVRNEYRFRARAAKFFLQPSLGITRSVFDVALSTRVVALKPFDVGTENYPEARLRQDDLAGVDRLWGFVEPAVTVRAGYKWVKLFFQYGYSLKLNEARLQRDEQFVSIGIQLALAPRFSL